MTLGENYIQTWEYMKHIFLKRYQYYCRAKEGIFEITQGEEEILEKYVECFQYNLQRSKLRQLGKDTLKKNLLKGIKNEYLEILSLMGTGDLFQLSYDDVCDLCRRYSRGKFKIGKNIPSSQSLQPHLNPYQPCSQILSISSYDHRDTLLDVATLPVPLHFPQYFQQFF